MHRLRRKRVPIRPKRCLSLIPFKIPQDMLTDTHANSFSLLLRMLPPEIIAQIFEQVESSVDAVCLAVSCKTLLNISAMCKLVVPDRVIHMPKWVPRLWNQEADRCTCVNMDALLQKLRLRDDRGRPSRAWGLCVDCVRFLPTSKTYWNGLRSEVNLAEWEKAEGHRWKNMVDYFSTGVRLQCPLCVVREWNYMEDLFNQRRAEIPSGNGEN